MIVDELVSVLGLQIKDDGLSSFRSSLTSTIGKLGLVVAGAIGAAAAISSLTNIARETSANAKFARAIGISTQELQKFEFAAKRMGVSAGTLPNILGQMQEKLNQIKTGGANDLFEAFSPLGIDIAPGGRAKGPLDLYLELADAVKNAADQEFALGQAHKAGFGVEFIEMLKRGKSGILELAASAETYSDSQVAAAEANADSLLLLEARVNKLKLEFGAPLLNFSTEAINALIKFSKTDAFSDLKKGIEDVVDALGRALGAMKSFYDELSKKLPEGSALAALLAGLAVAFPIPAAVAGTAYVGGKVVENKDAPAIQKLSETAEKYADLASRFSDFMDFAMGTGEAPSKSLRDFSLLPEDVREGARKEIKNFIDKLIVNVQSGDEANKVIDNADEKIRDAAQRGTGQAR